MADGQILIDSKIDSSGIGKGTKDLEKQFDRMAEAAEKSAKEAETALRGINTKNVADGMSESFDSESDKIKQILSETQTDARVNAEKIASVFRSSGTDSSTAFRKAWAIVKSESESGSDSVKRNLDEIGGKSKSVGNQLQSNLAGAFKGIATVATTYFGAQEIIQFGVAAVQTASDLEEVQNVVDSVFETMSGEADAFAKTAAKTAGLSETAAKKYLGTYGAMAKNFTSSEKEAYEMAEALTQLTGDVASFYNLDHDEAATKLKSIFTGETESLKELGIVMTQNTLQEYARQKGITKSIEKMTDSEKAALRYSFVLEKLSTASGDFVKTSEGWANQTRILALQFENIKASLGQGFINVLGPAVQKLNTEYMPALQGVADKFAQITEDGIDIGEIFGDVNFDPLISSLGPLGESFDELVGKLRSGLGTVWDEVLVPFGTWTIEEGLPAGINAVSSAMDMVSAVAEKAAPLVSTFWNEVAKPIGKGVGDLVTGTLDGLATGMESLATAAEQSSTTAAERVVNNWNQASEEMSTATSESFETMQQNAEDSFSGAASSASENWNEIKETVTSSVESIQGSIDSVEGKEVYIDIYERYHGGGGGTSGPAIAPSSYEPAAYTPSVASITPQIPYLATGAVIPPRAPFMAVLGDQRNGTNIEAPLDTIKQAVSDVIGEGAIEVHNYLHFDGDLAQLGRMLKPVIDSEARRKGGSLAKGAVT